MKISLSALCLGWSPRHSGIKIYKRLL